MATDVGVLQLPSSADDAGIYLSHGVPLMVQTWKGKEAMGNACRVIVLMLAGLASGIAAAGAVEPLAEVLKSVPVKPVAENASLTVPMITWGGDIATLVANGDQLRTRSGSLFADAGLDITLRRQDVFTEQLKAYLSGETPFLRGTLGMVQQAGDLLCRRADTCPKIIYQMTWSAGGDALVVGPNVRSVADLKGKRIAVQAYGPHVDYLTKILADGGLSVKDVQIVWMTDLTASADSPAEALLSGKADAATVIIPDALALTSGGNVGNGAEGSLKGARILLSTKTANRIIADVYAVRADYYAAHAGEVEAFVLALLKAQSTLAATVKSGGGDYQKTFSAAAEALLDSAQAVPDAEGLYADAEFVGLTGNVDFFQNAAYPRRFAVLAQETAGAFGALGLSGGKSALTGAEIDFRKLGKGLNLADSGQASRFNADAVASVVTRRQQQNALGDGELFSFEIFFEPNQQTFSDALYRADFDRVVALASTYGGAIITVEGHSDPLGYLRSKKAGETSIVLTRIKQSARNLSLSRAAAVRDSLMDYAAKKGVSLNADQFALVPHGIAQPKNGVCGSDPCAPNNEREWRQNMRVVFRIIQVEAEESVFRPL